MSKEMAKLIFYIAERNTRDDAIISITNIIAEVTEGMRSKCEWIARSWVHGEDDPFGVAVGIRNEIAALKAIPSESQRLRDALIEARRFMDYFANGHREFVGPGTPQSCLAHIEWALNPDVASNAPETRSCDGTDVK